MYMQEFLTERIPAERHAAVLRAIISKPLLVGQWAQYGERDCDEDKGCPGVVAAYAAVGRPINAEEVYAQRDNLFNQYAKEEFLSLLIGRVTREQVRRAWISWDRATPEERAACVEACRCKLEEIESSRARAFVRQLKEDLAATAANHATRVSALVTLAAMAFLYMR